MSLTLEIRDTLENVSCEQWNALNTDGNPFVRYEYLYGLEATRCLGAEKGWYPQYFLLWSRAPDTSESPAPAATDATSSTATAEADSNDSDKTDSLDIESVSADDDFGELVAAMPAYVKTHSYGEFVFDWAWADAYQRHGEEYYPKMICAIPFTPATGPRLLVRADQPFDAIVNVMVNTACQYAQDREFSSVHWLFTSPKDCKALCGESERLGTGQSNAELHDGSSDANAELPDGSSGANESAAPDVPILRRMDCQYHWQNNDYSSFDDFLSRCTAKRRKTLRRERRYVTDACIRLERRSGETLSDQEWSWVHQFYVSTFEAKWGNPSLTEAFFRRMGSTFGSSTLIVFAYDPNDPVPEQPIACSVMFHGGDCLYGRFWGCRKEHHCLHFETCYYQGIEHCIEHGITRFEPGAQGEHKITRGFVPTLTESAHFITHPGFREAISNYLLEEQKHVLERCSGLSDLLPFNNQTITLCTDANPVHSA